MLTEGLIKQCGLNAKEVAAFNRILKLLDNVIRWGRCERMPVAERESVAQHTINALHLAKKLIKNPERLTVISQMILVHDFGEAVNEIAQGQAETPIAKVMRKENEERVAKFVLHAAFEKNNKLESEIIKARNNKSIEDGIKELPVQMQKTYLFVRQMEEDGVKQLPAQMQSSRWFAKYLQVEKGETETGKLAKAIEKLDGHLKYKQATGKVESKRILDWASKFADISGFSTPDATEIMEHAKEAGLMTSRGKTKGFAWRIK